ncbi:MAG: hypothetical protein MI685_02490 [Chlorobiales bacterium]|nr:hypothetical protein [Chlorobiales bacterium]
MTPFSDEYRSFVEDTIKPIIGKAGFRPVLADSYEPGSIPEQIKRDISDATVCIAILTSENLNVAYEMGLAHMAAVPVIVLVEAYPEEISTKVNFDIRHHRILPYVSTEKGRAELAYALEKALPKLEDERILADILAPSSLSCAQSVIAAAPLSFREARQKVGGWATFRETFSDHFGIKGLLRNLSIIQGLDRSPELWNPNDFQDAVLVGDDRTPPCEMTVYSIGSPKVNRFTGLLMQKFFEDRWPTFSFVADERSPDLRDVRVSIKQGDNLYLNGINPDRDKRLKKDIGLIIRGPNPFCEKGMMLILAGRGPLGTEAACRAVLEPRGVRMLLEHLKISANTLQLSSAQTSEYSCSFWASVTMSAERAGVSQPTSLEIQEAKYFE